MASGPQWISSAVAAWGRALAPPPAGDGDLSPELADLPRLVRRPAVAAGRTYDGWMRWYRPVCRQRTENRWL